MRVRVRVCVRVRVRVRVHVRVRVRVCVHVRVLALARVCVYVHVHVLAWVCACAHVGEYACACVRTWACAHVDQEVMIDSHITTYKQGVVRLLHSTAVKRGYGQYIDPATGFSVFTALFLKKRACCGNRCRYALYCSWRGERTCDLD